MYIDRADTVQAYIWAPEELELAVTQYGIGLDALRRYKLDAGIEALSLSKGYGQKAVRLAPQRKQEYQTESLQKEIEDELQEASEMTIITEEGRVIQPEERSRPEPDQQSLRVPLPATTAVLGDVSEMSLLDQARELYSLGVEAKEQGDYKQANEYFRQAGKLIHKYKSMSVGRTRVTTVYETNTLWFIAKYEWGNPALWPLIWEYNQGAIRDPDLIHPGDTVFIPAW